MAIPRSASTHFLKPLGEANLDWLIQIGQGDKPVTEARFRCRDCGEIEEKQVRPPVRRFQVRSGTS